MTSAHFLVLRINARIFHVISLAKIGGILLMFGHMLDKNRARTTFHTSRSRGDNAKAAPSFDDEV